MQSHSLPFKGNGTDVPEGLSQVTLTRLRHPLPEVEGKVLQKDIKLTCHPELVSESHACFTHNTSPLTKRKAVFTLCNNMLAFQIFSCYFKIVRKVKPEYDFKSLALNEAKTVSECAAWW